MSALVISHMTPGLPASLTPPGWMGSRGGGKRKLFKRTFTTWQHVTCFARMVFVSVTISLKARNSSCRFVPKLSNFFVAPWTVAARLLCPWDLPAGILERAVISFSGKSDPRIKPVSPALAGRFFTTEPTAKPKVEITVPILEVSRKFQIFLWAVFQVPQLAVEGAYLLPVSLALMH